MPATCPACVNITNWQELCKDCQVKVAHYEGGDWKGNEAMKKTWSRTRAEQFKRDVEKPDPLNDSLSLSATAPYLHRASHSTGTNKTGATLAIGLDSVKSGTER